MNKKFKIALFTLGILVIPNGVQAVQTEEVMDKKIEIKNQVIDMPWKNGDLDFTKEENEILNTIGEIKKVNFSGKDTSILIKSQGFIRTGFNDLILWINEDTEIVDENGNKLCIKDIQETSLVKAYYKPTLTRSLPPQSSAVRLVVLKDDNAYTVEKFLHEKDEATIDMAQVATICFKENKTTGYVWNYTIEDPIVELAHETEVKSYEDKMLMGQEDEHYWHFKGVKPGKTTITFKLLRPWEGENKAIKTYKFQVNVDPKKDNLKIYYPNKNIVVR